MALDRRRLVLETAIATSRGALADPEPLDALPAGPVRRQAAAGAVP